MMMKLPHFCYDLPNKPLSEITVDDYPPYMRGAIREVEEMSKRPHTFEEFIAQSRRARMPLEDDDKAAKAE